MAIDPRAAELRDRLRGTLIAAAATPMTAAGEVDLDLVSRYFAGLIADGADGLAVLAHTGRGPFLPQDLRAAIIERAAALGVPVIVGIGGTPPPPDISPPATAKPTDAFPAATAKPTSAFPSPTAEPTGVFPSGTAEPLGASPLGAAEPGGAFSTSTAEPDAGFGERDGVSVVEEAQVAVELGADGVMLFPSEGDRLAAHDAVWQATGLPMIAFDLYTMPCPPEVLSQIVRHPGVAGLKTALLSDAMGCQETIAITRAAGRLAITGEDRMFGPSLLWGAEAALVGLAAAHVGVTAAVMRAFRASTSSPPRRSPRRWRATSSACCGWPPKRAASRPPTPTTCTAPPSTPP